MKARTVLFSLVLGLAVTSVTRAGSVGLTGTGGSGAGFGLVPGDTNGDGTVDFLDYLVLKSHMYNPAPMTWANGDLDADGHVSRSDLLILEQNFGASRQTWSPSGGGPPPAGPTAHAPEPLTMLGLIMGVGGLACYIRKRQLA